MRTMRHPLTPAPTPQQIKNRLVWQRYAPPRTHTPQYARALRVITRGSTS